MGPETMPFDQKIIDQPKSENFVGDLLEKAGALYKTAVDSKIYAQAFEKIKSVEAQDVADFLTKERESALIGGGGKIVYDFATSITGTKAITDWLMFLLDKAGLQTSVQGDVTKYFKENDMERALLGITSSVIELRQTRGNKKSDGKTPAEAKMYEQSKINLEATVKSFNARIEKMNVPAEKKIELRQELKKIIREHASSRENLEKGQSQEFDLAMRKYTGAKVSAFKLGKDGLNSALTMTGLFALRGASYVAFSALERGKKEWDNYSREAYKTKQEAGKIDGKKADWKSTYSEVSAEKTGQILKETVWGSAKETYNELIYGRKDGQLKGEEKLRRQEIKKQEQDETEKTLQQLEKNGVGIFGQSWYLVKRELEIMKKNAPENFIKNITRLRALGTAGAFLGIVGTGAVAYANEGDITSTLTKAYDNLIAGAGERGRLETVSDNMFGAVDRFGKLFDAEEWHKRIEAIKKTSWSIFAGVMDKSGKEAWAEEVPEPVKMENLSYEDYGNKLYVDYRKQYNNDLAEYNQKATEISKLRNELKYGAESAAADTTGAKASELLQKETELEELTEKIYKNENEYRAQLGDLERIKAEGQLPEAENIPENLKAQNQKYVEYIKKYDADKANYDKIAGEINGLIEEAKTPDMPENRISQIDIKLHLKQAQLNRLKIKMDQNSLDYLIEKIKKSPAGTLAEQGVKTGGIDEQIINQAMAETEIDIADDKVREMLVRVMARFEDDFKLGAGADSKSTGVVKNFIKIAEKISKNKAAEKLLDEEVLFKMHDLYYDDTAVDKLEYILEGEHITGKGGGQEKLRQAILENILKTGDIDNSLATVYKGEGVIHSIRRQLEASPAKYNYDGVGSFQDVHQWSAKMAQEIAENEGFIVREGKTIIQYGVKEANSNAFKLGEAEYGDKESSIRISKNGVLEFEPILKTKNGEIKIDNEDGSVTKKPAVEELVNKKILYRMKGKAIVEADEEGVEDDEEDDGAKPFKNVNIWKGYKGPDKSGLDLDEEDEALRKAAEEAEAARRAAKKEAEVPPPAKGEPGLAEKTPTPGSRQTNRPSIYYSPEEIEKFEEIGVKLNENKEFSALDEQRVQYIEQRPEIFNDPKQAKIITNNIINTEDRLSVVKEYPRLMDNRNLPGTKELVDYFERTGKEPTPEALEGRAVFDKMSKQDFLNTDQKVAYMKMFYPNSDRIEEGAKQMFGQNILKGNSEIIQGKNGAIEISNAYNKPGISILISQDKIGVKSQRPYDWGDLSVDKYTQKPRTNFHFSIFQQIENKINRAAEFMADVQSEEEAAKMRLPWYKNFFK